MNIIESTVAPGIKVAANAGELAVALAAGDLTMQLLDGDGVAVDLIANDGYGWIEGELVKVSAHGTTATISRGQAGGGAADSHALGAFCREQDGYELLTHTFSTGSEWLSQIRAGGDRKAWFGLMVDGTIKYISLSTNEQLEVVWASPQYQPVIGTVIKVIVWTTLARQFWAEMAS